MRVFHNGLIRSTHGISFCLNRWDERGAIEVWLGPSEHCPVHHGPMTLDVQSSFKLKKGQLFLKSSMFQKTKIDK